MSNLGGIGGHRPLPDNVGPIENKQVSQKQLEKVKIEKEKILQNIAKESGALDKYPTPKLTDKTLQGRISSFKQTVSKKLETSSKKMHSAAALLKSKKPSGKEIKESVKQSFKTVRSYVEKQIVKEDPEIKTNDKKFMDSISSTVVQGDPRSNKELAKEVKEKLEKDMNSTDTVKIENEDVEVVRQFNFDLIGREGHKVSITDGEKKPSTTSGKKGLEAYKAIKSVIDPEKDEKQWFKLAQANTTQSVALVPSFLNAVLRPKGKMIDFETENGERKGYDVDVSDRHYAITVNRNKESGKIESLDVTINYEISVSRANITRDNKGNDNFTPEKQIGTINTSESYRVSISGDDKPIVFDHKHEIR